MNPKHQNQMKSENWKRRRTRFGACKLIKLVERLAIEKKQKIPLVDNSTPAALKRSSMPEQSEVNPAGTEAGLRSMKLILPMIPKTSITIFLGKLNANIKQSFSAASIYYLPSFLAGCFFTLR